MTLDLDECLRSKWVDIGDAEVASLEADGGPVLRVRTGREADYSGVTLRAPAGSWDLSAYTFISLDVKNLSDDALALVCWSADTTGKRPRDYGMEIAPGETYPVHINIGPIAPAWTADVLPGMFCNPLGFPAGQGGWAHPNLDPTIVTSIHFALSTPRRDYVFEISNVRARGNPFQATEELVRDEKRFFPFMDKFGQYLHNDWPGKTHSADELRRRRDEEVADLTRQPGPADWEQYGGWSGGPQLEATGFFRPVKHDSRWWLVDPEGRLFWSNGMDCVRVGGETRIEGRERFFAEIPGEGGFVAANLARKYGEDWQAQFAEVTHRRLRSWGINTIGNWSDERFYLERRTPYTVAIHYRCPRLVGGERELWGHDLPDPFDLGFERSLRERLEAEKGKSAGDSWCLGYFIDNELPWWSAAIRTLESPPEQAAKRALAEQLKAKYGTVEGLNRAWETSYESWSGFLATRESFQWGSPRWLKSREDRDEFARRHHEEYFRICRELIGEIAPGNLYLGCRFNTAGREEIAERAAAEYCDIVSYNQYKHSVAGFRLPEGVDKPVVIGEFHFGALDRGMFWNASVQVADEEERAEAYRGYLRSALDNSVIVGAHWFAYGDEAATGRGDGENGQIGFLDVCDTPYAEMVQAARQVGSDLYRRRAHSE